MSKNYGLKIAVRVYVRIYARAYDCQDSTGTEHRRKKRGTQAKQKPVYICMIADDEKNIKKS